MPRRHVEQDNFDFERENERLREQVEVLSEKLLLVTKRLRSRVYLLVCAFVGLGKIALRFYVPAQMYQAMDLAFFAGVGALMIAWVFKGWREFGLVLVPDLVLIANCYLAAVFCPWGDYALVAGLLVSTTRTLELLTLKGLDFLEGLYDDKGKVDSTGK